MSERCAHGAALGLVRELTLTVRTLAEAEIAAAFIAELCPEPARQALGVCELLVNAVEHGSLEIDGRTKAELLRTGAYHGELARRAEQPELSAREVTVRLRRLPDHIEFVCEDQGPGFDWRAFERTEPPDPDAPSGRGIVLARSLSFDSLEFRGRGNVVVARAGIAPSTTGSTAPSSEPCSESERRLARIARSLGPELARQLAGRAEEGEALLRERARQREEQELARHLVGGMLREGCLDAAGIRHLIAAKDLFNGDIALAARLPDGGLRWMLGDFVGHGLPAAIGGLPLASMFYATCRKGIPLPEVVATMNDSLLSTLPRGFFCAAILLELSADGEWLRAWNGGMPAGLVRSCDSRSVRQLISRDLPLGAVPSPELAIPIESLAVRAGDRVLCFSDGLPETQRMTGELYGLERAIGVASSGTSEGIFDALLASLADFRGAGPPSDDLSLVEVTVGAV